MSSSVDFFLIQDLSLLKITSKCNQLKKKTIRSRMLHMQKYTHIPLEWLGEKHCKPFGENNFLSLLVCFLVEDGTFKKSQSLISLLSRINKTMLSIFVDTLLM